MTEQNIYQPASMPPFSFQNTANNLQGISHHDPCFVSGGDPNGLL